MSMTTSAARKRDSFHRSIAPMGIALLLVSSSPVAAQDGSVIGSNAIDCPNTGNPPLRGYDSVPALNADMLFELDRIQQPDETIPESYDIYFCPDTTLNTGAEELQPVLNQATFYCGRNGSVNDNCVLSGGEQNLRVRDSEVEGYQIELVTFKGLTFEDFDRHSVNLRGVAGQTAVLEDCVWQNFNGAEYIFRIRNQQGLDPMSLVLRQSTIQSTTGSESAVNGFLNEGGTMEIDSLTVEGVEVDTMIRTEGEGTITVSDSTFQNNNFGLFLDSREGSIDLQRVDITGNTLLGESFFFVTGETASANLDFVTFDSNTADSAFDVVLVDTGGTMNIADTVFSNNSPVNYVIYALAETADEPVTVNLIDTDFIANSGNIGASLLLAENEGSVIEINRAEFVENTGALSNIGAFFGSEIRFFDTCFIRNSNAYVVLVLDSSSYVASDNYVEDEISTNCATDNRLSVEVPGSLCFLLNGPSGADCPVTCEPETNDAISCLAIKPTAQPSESPSEQPSSSNQPSTPLPTLSQQPSVSQSPSGSSELPSSVPTVTVIVPTGSPTESLLPTIFTTESPTTSSSPTQSEIPSIFPTLGLDMPSIVNATIYRPPLRPPSFNRGKKKKPDYMGKGYRKKGSKKMIRPGDDGFFYYKRKKTNKSEKKSSKKLSKKFSKSSKSSKK